MKNSVKKIATALLLAIFIGSTIMMIRQGSNYKQADHSYKEAENLAKLSQGTETKASIEGVTEERPAREEVEAICEESNLVDNIDSQGETLAVLNAEVKQDSSLMWEPIPVEEDSVVEELKTIDLTALREMNDDVIGWIHIPDTVIDYPLLQGEDNQYYLNHTWDNKENAVGAIFMESTNTSDFSDFHTIVYGHNMKSKTMFSAIKNYWDESYWREHPYIYIVSEDGVYRYEVYASYEASVTSDTYRLGFKEEGKKVFLEMGIDNSVIDTGNKPAITDRILTLSTCTGNGHDTRWVVQAYLKMKNIDVID